MKKHEITIGQNYIARVSGKLVTVRVDAIRERYTGLASNARYSLHYDVTNLATGRRLTFRSAQKFRGIARPFVNTAGINEPRTMLADEIREGLADEVRQNQRKFGVA